MDIYYRIICLCLFFATLSFTLIYVLAYRYIYNSLYTDTWLRVQKTWIDVPCIHVTRLWLRRFTHCMLRPSWEIMKSSACCFGKGPIRTREPAKAVVDSLPKKNISQHLQTSELSKHIKSASCPKRCTIRKRENKKTRKLENQKPLNFAVFAFSPFSRLRVFAFSRLVARNVTITSARVARKQENRENRENQKTRKPQSRPSLVFVFAFLPFSPFMLLQEIGSSFLWPCCS